jgi:hypothetical protein
MLDGMLADMLADKISMQARSNRKKAKLIPEIDLDTTYANLPIEPLLCDRVLSGESMGVTRREYKRDQASISCGRVRL